MYAYIKPGNLRIIIPATITGFDVSIHSATGTLIQSQRNLKDRQMDIAGLQPGIYTVKIISQNDKAVYTKKVIVQ